MKTVDKFCRKTSINRIHATNFDNYEAKIVAEKKQDTWHIGSINFNWLKNKYILAAILFCMWVLFFDQNNLVERFQNQREKKQLENDKEYYIRKTTEDRERLEELKTNNENLEKFAREQYLMKKENEEVFVIVEE